MKMDIEGAEAKVLTELEKSGILCGSNNGGVDYITLEFHDPKNPNDGHMDPLLALKLRLEDACKQPAIILQLDSEAYYNDATPLPIPKFVA